MAHNIRTQDLIPDTLSTPETHKANVSRENKKYTSALESFTCWVLDNQTALSLHPIALVFLAHICMPEARKHTSRFLTISHRNPTTGLYAIGDADLYFISFCVLLLTGVRVAYVIRFTEQGWVLTYYNVLWPVGMYLYCISPYSFNMDELFLHWPKREIDGPTKAYFLLQLSYCIQEVFVINVEDRRKDHWQMLTHHYVTITLIYASYVYHMTRIGHLSLVLMDFIDIILPLAKCLKYLGFTTICDILFGVFIFSWFVTRHVLYIVVCYSVYVSTPRIVKPACYHGSMDNLQGPFPTPKTGWSYYLDPFLNPVRTICWDTRLMLVFVTFLVFLEGLMIMWFSLIVRVAIKVLSGNSVEDVRSDNEEEVEEIEEEARPIEEQVNVEGLNLGVRERRTAIKRTAASTPNGVSLSRHSHTKALLKRIGCEKQIE